jgi:hypothetical protein
MPPFFKGQGMDWKKMQDMMHKTTLTTFGEEVTYVPRTGSPYTIANAIFDENYLAVDPNTGVTVQSDSPILRVRLDDMQSQPQPGDRVTIRAIEYRVNSYEKDSEGGASLPLHRV